MPYWKYDKPFSIVFDWRTALSRLFWPLLFCVLFLITNRARCAYIHAKTFNVKTFLSSLFRSHENIDNDLLHFIHNRCFVAHLSFTVYHSAASSFCSVCYAASPTFPIINLCLGFIHEVSSPLIACSFIYFSLVSTIKIGFDLVLRVNSLL